MTALHDPLPNSGSVFRIAVAIGFIAFLISQGFGIASTIGLAIFVAVIVIVILLGVIGLLLTPYNQLARPGSTQAYACNKEGTVIVIDVTCPRCGTHITVSTPPSGQLPGQVN
jgi:hypothetical protein